MRIPNVAKLFRWKYVAPRVAAAVLIALALRYGLDGVLRWTIVASGQAALGAKVEVGDLETRLVRGQLLLNDVVAANPKKPLCNLAQADQIRLSIDTGQLLHKRVVVRNGVVSGLQFDRARTTSGSLADSSGESTEDSGPSRLDPLVDAAQNRADQWLDDLAARLEGDLTAQLETPRLVQQLEARWPQQYQALKARAETVRADSKQIEVDFREVRKNPLRNVDRLQQLQQRIVAVEKELRLLGAAVNQLPNQAEADRIALQTARTHDEEFLRDQLSADALDGDQLSRYLLGEEAGKRLSTAIHWIKLARAAAPSKKLRIDGKSRHRGVNVLFIDQPQPTWLVQRVRLDGQASIAGNPLKLVGALTNATSHPELLDQPLRLELDGSGGIACQLAIEIDRRTSVDRDLITFDCPILPLPGRTLGDADRMAIALAPSKARIAAEIRVVDEQLTGTIELTQQQVSMSASVPAIRDPQLGKALSKAFASLERFEAQVTLSGTIEQPQWQLQSDLGSQMAEGFNLAVKGYLAERGEQVLAKVQAQVEEQVATLDAKRRDAQEELLAKLGGDQQLLAQLTSLTGLGRPDASTIDIPQLGNVLKSGFLKR